MIKTNSIVASDGVTLTFDVAGSGPALVLLHGMGHTRKAWHEQGYIERLANKYTVIAPDTRGEMGDSGKPTDTASYTIERMNADIIEIVDACGVDEFVLWGFSYGANIGRYLAKSSPRVKKFIQIGIPFGHAVQGRFRAYIEEFIEHWPPILEAQRNGTLDLDALSAEDREDLEAEDMNVPLAWLTAMLDWGSVEPADIRCPTLWLSGTRNENTMASIEQYAAALREPNCLVQVETVAGLNHQEEFAQIDDVLPLLLKFTED